MQIASKNSSRAFFPLSSPNEERAGVRSRVPISPLVFLADLATLFAMLFAGFTMFFMFRLDAFPVRASVFVVIDLAVGGWIFR
jgi:hypothetical protein